MKKIISSNFEVKKIYLDCLFSIFETIYLIISFPVYLKLCYKFGWIKKWSKIRLDCKQKLRYSKIVKWENNE